jgi:hypothetical protein
MDGITSLPHRNLDPLEEVVSGEGGRRHPRTLHRGLRRLLVQAQVPSPPVAAPSNDGSGNDPSHGKPYVAEPPLGVQEGLQLGLVLPRCAPSLVLSRHDHDPLGVRRQPPVVIMEVEPAALPPTVRRGNSGSICARSESRWSMQLPALTTCWTFFTSKWRDKGSARNRWS